MPVEVWQKYTEDANVSIYDPTVDLEFGAMGSETAGTIYDALAALLPATYRGLYLHYYRVNHRGAGVWDVRAHYAKESPLKVGQRVFSADSTGGTIHRESALSTVSQYVETPGTERDFGGLIGVSKDSIAGADVPSQKFQFQFQKKQRATDLPPTYMRDFYRNTGKMNSLAALLSWKGQIMDFAPYELVFMGGPISDGGRDADEVELIDFTYKFEYSPRVEDLAIGSITEIVKEGWDILWVHYREEIRDGYRVKYPIQVNTERVLESFDFATLLI